MYRKINIRLLLGVMLVLLAVVVIAKISESRKGDSSFNADLFTFDTTGVSSVVINQKTDSLRTLVLERRNDVWEVKQGQKTFRTNLSQVMTLLNQLSSLRIESVVGKSKNSWKEFQVGDSASYSVQVKKGNKVLSDIVIGKFQWIEPTNPNDRQGKVNSYVRTAGDEVTYTVNGFLQTIVSTDPGVFRDRKILMLDNQSVTGLKFSYPDSSCSLTLSQGKWMMNGGMADSARVDEYLKNIMQINGAVFADPVPEGKKPIFSLIIQQSSGSQVEVQAYVFSNDGDYVLTSGMNPGTYFTVRTEVMQRIFKGKSWFGGN